MFLFFFLLQKEIFCLRTKFWRGSTWDFVTQLPSRGRDLRAGAVVGRSWFSVSEGIFIYETGSILTRLKKKFAAVKSRRWRGKIAIEKKKRNNEQDIEVL